MRESELTERLDARDRLDDARGPGCYAVECAVPDAEADVAVAWDNHHDARPDGAVERLAAADRVAYVGAATDVYGRLCEHCTGRRHGATFVEIFPVRDVVAVWPDETPFESEYNRARELSADDWLVWTDGELL